MRFSSFFGSRPRALRGLGDLACERSLLRQLAAQFFYSLTVSEAETRAALEAFLYAYLGSTIYASNPVFPTAPALFVLVQGFMVEFLGDSPNVDTLFAIETPTLENLTDWSGRVEIPYIEPRTRVQAEAAMILCQTPAVDPVAAATAAAERARRDAETARATAAEAAATSATATGTPTSATARAEAAAAAAIAAIAAQFATAAAAVVANIPASTPETSEPPAVPRPGGFVLNPGSTFWPVLTPAQRTALVAAQNSGGGGGDTTTTSYLPYIAGGGLLLLAAAVFTTKSVVRKRTSGQVTT